MSDDDDQIPAPSIPISWKVGGQVVGTQRLVQQPTEGEVNLFSDPRVKTCGSCKFFDRNEKTLEKFRQTDFWRRLKYDYKWKTRYLPGKPEELGLCGVQDGTCVGPQSRACNHYKLKR